MTERLFQYVGYSTRNGQTRVRYASDAHRVAQLERTGNTDIYMRELPKPVTKLEAVAFLHALASGDGYSDAVYELVDVELARLQQLHTRQLLRTGSAEVTVA